MTQQPRCNPIPTSATSNDPPRTPTVSNHCQHDNTFSTKPKETQCDCSEDDDIDEISEKRQKIFDGSNPGPSGFSTHFNTKIVNCSSSDSSSFEEVEPKLIDENWEVIEKTAGLKPAIDEMVGLSSMPTSDFPVNPEVRKLTRRRSDSSLLSLRKSKSIYLDSSEFDPSQSCSTEVKKLKISCSRCGKAKSNIKLEILKLSEQLLSSNKSETEVNSKIKEVNIL
jgi:hypothetical protein